MYNHNLIKMANNDRVDAFGEPKNTALADQRRAELAAIKARRLAASHGQSHTGGKRRSKRAHSKRRAHRKSHRRH